MSRTREEKGFILINKEAITVQIFDILPHFPITVFISKLVRLHGVLSFQNKYMSGNLWLLMRKCSDIIFKWQRTKLKYVLYFHAKLWDAARKWGANTEHHGNVVLVWAYKIKCTCFENSFCPWLPANSQKSWTYQKATDKTSTILCRRFDNCLDAANLYSWIIKSSTKTCVF